MRLYIPNNVRSDSMDENSVIFKGTVNGLTIILRPEDNFEDILAVIEKKVESAGKFFRGAILDVRYRGKKLSPDEEKRLFELLVSKSGAEIKSLQEGKEEIPQPVQQEPPQNHPFRLKVSNFFFKGIDEGPTKFHKGTVRSGQLISYDGNVVIIGDVNPGGVVEAAGNVIVMGSLRGIVHACADGNRDAVVVALNLQPMQLRIADLITRAPDEKEVRNTYVPEMAVARDGMVYIERYLR